MGMQAKVQPASASDGVEPSTEDAEQLAGQLTGQLTELQEQLSDAGVRADLAESKVKNLQAALEEAESTASVYEDQVCILAFLDLWTGMYGVLGWCNAHERTRPTVICCQQNMRWQGNCTAVDQLYCRTLAS